MTTNTSAVDEVERILAFPKAHVDTRFRLKAASFTKLDGLIAFKEPSLLNTHAFINSLCPADGHTEDFFHDRPPTEKNFNLTQPLPYTMVVMENRGLFVYQRTKLVGEERLAMKYSVGVGGHFNPVDLETGFDEPLTVTEGMFNNIGRELGEELTNFPNTFQLTFTYFIRDNSNDVGKVHLGIVYQVTVPEMDGVECKEEELITVGWMGKDGIITTNDGRKTTVPFDQFENWSQFLVKEWIED